MPIAIGLALAIPVESSKTETGYATLPEEYVAILKSLQEEKGKIYLRTDYFLYDITGDGQPELWVSAGTCEADTELLAYTLKNGKTKRIYKGAGGHSDYFVYEGNLQCVMCHTGSGVVITYRYNGKKVKDSMVEFSMWNEECTPKTLSDDSVAERILDFWCTEAENIELQPFKTQ